MTICYASRHHVLMSFIHSGLTQDLPRSTLTVTPDNTVFTGERVRLTCVIESDHRDWRYEWRKNSVKLQSSQRYTVNTDTLTIRAVTTSDEGQYTCRGQRDKRPNSSQSSSVSLSVKDLPKTELTVTPERPVFTGETVNLKCVIESYTDWRYEWNKVRNKVSDRYTVNTDTLTIRAVTTSDEGQYTCRGQRDERPNSSQESERIDLAVNALPRSTLTVTPDTVFTGERVILTCVINSDHRDWRYEWNKDSTEVSERLTVDRNTLTIEGSESSDEGQYTCRGHIEGRSVSSQSSSVSLSVKDLPKTELTVTPDRPVFSGETVNLKCVIESEHRDWRYEWWKDSVKLQSSERYTVNTHTLTIRAVTTSDAGQYTCRGQRDKRPNSSQSSSAVSLSVTERPKPVVKVSPDQRVFRGETVTLTCVIQRGGHIQWTYSWFKDGSVIRDVTERVFTITSVSDRAEYSCRGERSDSQRSHISAALTLTVSAEAQAAVRVSPQPWLTEGDSVTLICEVTVSSTGWTFSWFRDDDHLSDSSRGAGGSYTLSPAARQHTGVYTCRAERGRPAYYTNTSNTQPLWITGVSPSVSLVVRPSRSQHFSSDSLSLSCEDQTNSSGWTVRRYTDRNTEDCSKLTGSTCRLVSLSTSDSGVYWCQSESGEKHHPLNITVHDGDVILESSVDPVIKGHTLTLHCLHRSTNSPILRADFYKDGSLVQNQTTGEMIITTVSESDEGFYYCKTERGQSLHSWISVRGSSSDQISFYILRHLLVICPYLLVTVVLLYKCSRVRVKSPEAQRQSL